MNIVNDSPYPVTRYVNRKRVWTCPIYGAWYSMWQRVQNLTRNPSYEGYSVCEEWRHFSNFLDWVNTQDWENKFLDKDLLVEGNRQYSPTACIFVSREVNNVLVFPSRKRDLPLGVSLKSSNKTNPYLAQCGGKYLGYYPTAHEAHKAWQMNKINRIQALLTEEKSEKVKQGLERVKTKLETDFKENRETITL